MDSDKKHIVQCDCQDEESDVRECVEQQVVVVRKESRRGSCLLTTLFLFLLAVIGLTSLAVTAKLFLDVADTKFNVQLASSSSSDDVTAADAEQNAIKDHVIERAKHQILSTALDYKKKLEVLKVQNELSGRVVCYVTPLMDGRLDDDMQRNAVTYTTPAVTTMEPTPARRTFHFIASDTPINDVTFLGQEVEEMCAGVDTYWIIPTDPANTRDAQVLDSGHRDVISDGRGIRRRREAAPQQWWQDLVYRPQQQQQQQQNYEMASANFRMLERYDRPRDRWA